MKKKGFFISILILITLLTGCVTTSEISELTPLNLYSKRRFSGDNKIYFIGEGRADTQRQAELLSFVDLNTKVYNYLGLDVEPESYKELSIYGTISAYNLKIQERNTYSADGQIIVALVATADERLLAADRSPDILMEQEVAQKAIDLVLQGDECMKENKDLDGLRYYLQSMVYSYGLNYIEDEFSFPSIMEEVLNVLKELSITISNEKPEEASCKITLTRSSTLIPSRVKDCEIKATFDSIDPTGESFVDSFMYTTNNRGIIDFVPMTYNFAKKGTVVFTFDFETEIENIEKLSPFTASSIRSEIEGKSVSFEYSQIVDSLPIAICVQCDDYKGDSDKSSWLTDILIEKYAESGIEAYAFAYIENESEQDLLQRFREIFPDGHDVIVLRVGTNSTYETRMDITSIETEGSVVVYDSISGEVLYDSGICYANGFGSTLEEAQDFSFENFIQKMLTLLKAYYV